MSKIRAHRDRTRGPEAKRAARAKRAERAAMERLATATERAYLAILAGGAK